MLSLFLFQYYWETPWIYHSARYYGDENSQALTRHRLPPLGGQSQYLVFASLHSVHQNDAYFGLKVKKKKVPNSFWQYHPGDYNSRLGFSNSACALGSQKRKYLCFIREKGIKGRRGLRNDRTACTSSSLLTIFIPLYNTHYTIHLIMLMWGLNETTSVKSSGEWTQ